MTQAAAQSADFIVVSTGQYGFVGRTGREIRIDRDGSYRIMSVIVARREDEASGRIAPETVERLALSLRRNGFQDLPPVIEIWDSVNPADAIITFGGETRRLVDRPGAEFREISPERLRRLPPAERRFRTILADILQAVRQ